MNKPAKLPTVEQAQAANLRIWDALSKTDPAQTKQFSRAGGFKGTAVKPMWVIKRLTEEFGPCGEGWGIGEPRFDTVHAQNGDSLVYCTVSCWHGTPENVLYGVGGDKIAGTNKHGPYTDDEAFKKAFTDAVNNAFKFVGVAADIHMGLFDDSKYLAEIRQEFDEAKREKIPGISAIKKTLNKLMLDGDKATDLDAFNALVHACKDELTAIRDGNHEYWTGDGADNEGFKAWIKRRREELGSKQESTLYQLLASTVNECTSLHDLRAWLEEHGDKMAELDGEEGRRFEEFYNLKEGALKALEDATAGA
jgi:hypothetical protein